MITCSRFQDFDVYSEYTEKQFRYIHITQPDFYGKLCEYLLSPEIINAHTTFNIDVETELSIENYREIYDRLIQFIDFEKVINVNDLLDPSLKAILDAELINFSTDLRKDKWGRVGEYIFNIILDTYFNLDCVIRKFALNTSPNMPVYGIDTVHCSLENKCLFFGESKFVSNLSNGVELINKSLEKYEAQISKEYFNITNTNFRRNPKFLDEFQKYLNLCYTFSEFIDELKIETIGIPIFIAHAGNYNTTDIFNELRKIKKKTLFGLKTEYIVISFPVINKENFRKAFVTEANHQIEEIKKCQKR